MGNSKELHCALASACDQLTKNYQETLNSVEVDEKTWKLLYNLGADIKHTFDAFADAIEKYIAE